MKGRLAALAMLLLDCHQQDAALLVTFTGGYQIPQNADHLKVDIFDAGQVITSRAYQLTTNFPATLTLVQSGGTHKTVKINATLTLTQNGQTAVVGLGTATSDFQDGQTVKVGILLTPPQ